MRNVTMKQVELEVANMELVAEYKEAMAVNDNEWAVEVAMLLLNNSNIQFKGLAVVPKSDRILILDADGRRANRIAEEEAEELKAKRSAGIVKYAKEGVGYAVNAMNGAVNMEEVIRYFNGKEIAGAYVRPVGLKGSGTSKTAGTGRRSNKKYYATEIVDGRFVLTSAARKVEIKAKEVKLAKKQVEVVVYVEGDKGYTAPKGKATPKQVKNKKAVVVLPEVKENIEVMIPMNLQLCASGSASTSQTNNTNTNNEGEKNMKNVLEMTTQDKKEAIISALSATSGEGFVQSLVNDRTLLLGKYDTVDYARTRLWSQRGVAVSEVTLVDDRKLESTDEKAKNTSKKAGCKVEKTLLAGSYMTDQLEKFVGTKTISMGTYNLTVGTEGVHDYTNDMLVVKFESANEIQLAKSFGFYYAEESENVYLRTFDKDGSEVLCKNGLETVTDEATIELIKSQAMLYVQFIWSAGQKKKDATYFINANKYDVKARFELLNGMTGGTLSEVAEAKIKEVGYLDEETMEKLVSRFPLFATGAIEFGTLATDRFGVLYIDGKFSGMKDVLKDACSKDERIAKLVASLSDEIIDGQVLESNLSVAEHFLESFNVLVNPKDLIGFDYQGRTQVISTKAFVTVEEHEALQELAQHLIALYGDKARVFGNPNCIGLVTDANGAKLVPVTDKTDFKNYLLEVAVPTGVSSSGQLFDIVRYMAGRIGKIDKLEDFIYASAKVNAERKIEAMTTQVLSKNASCENILMAVNKNVALTDVMAMTKFANAVDKMMISTSSKNKFSMEGYSYRALFENTFLWGEGVVENILGADNKYVYAYCNHILRVKSKEITDIYNTWVIETNKATTEVEKIAAKTRRKYALDKILCGTVIKYPAVSMYEAEIIRCLTKFELKELFMEAAKQAGLKFSDRKILNAYKWFLNRGEGSIVLAPINMLKDKHAGMDTDFDPINVFFEDALVDIVREYKTTCGGEMTLITKDTNIDDIELDMFVEEFTNAIDMEEQQVSSIESLL